MRFVKFSPEHHYQILQDWWIGHDWPIIPLASLPKNGLIVYHNDIPVCAGFVYSTDSNIAWIEWFICDPKADREYRSKYLDELVIKLNDLAKFLGYDVAFVSAKNAGLLHRLQNHGYNITEQDMVNLIKVL